MPNKITNYFVSIDDKIYLIAFISLKQNKKLFLYLPFMI